MFYLKLRCITHNKNEFDFEMTISELETNSRYKHQFQNLQYHHHTYMDHHLRHTRSTYIITEGINEELLYLMSN